MKTDIHPTYYSKAKVKCACGNEFTVGSTREEINVEICSACHPFYTGQEKIIDTAGRVERFKARQKAAVDKKEVLATKKKMKASGATRQKKELVVPKKSTAKTKISKSK
ncbi:MAG: 50S ribosomal protein L31 [Parcubacteria group bacterium]|nr:50S ribosomal protein L31 [Parcubacteria group bacterium]MBI2049108.1 50S ribosomal protein L31 [Parcubacteria group bacterium]